MKNLILRLLGVFIVLISLPLGLIFLILLGGIFWATALDKIIQEAYENSISHN